MHSNFARSIGAPNIDKCGNLAIFWTGGLREYGTGGLWDCRIPVPELVEGRAFACGGFMLRVFRVEEQPVP